ncbi:MAG: hypothetical protein HYY26_00840 [Acidobacteria bacterium]|nr:hypothetical protein [Acidobacteriota bacterium]
MADLHSLFAAPPPPNPWPRRLLVAALIVAVVAGVLYWQFRYYAEIKQVERFMEALQAGDYPKAYQLWKPTPAYTYDRFLEDWGETTPLGRVRSYEIVGVEKGPSEIAVRGGPTLRMEGASSGVVVRVRINGVDPPVRLWVESKDKSLSFPPF